MTSFTVPFPYISPADITVRVNEELTTFTWITDATINIDPPPVGLVEIRRLTPKDDGLLALSALYCAQEAADSAATVAAALDALQLASYAALRAYTGPHKAVYITGTGVKGLFVRNDSDKTSLDDGGVTIVSTSEVRWERAYGMVVDSAWYSPVGNGVANDYPMLLAATVAP